MATHKPFRELIKPGTNFDFIGRARLFTTISFIAVREPGGPSSAISATGVPWGTSNA